MESKLFSFFHSHSDIFIGAWSRQSGRAYKPPSSLKRDWLAKLFCPRAACLPEPGCWQVLHAQILKQVSSQAAGCRPGCLFLRQERGERIHFGERGRLHGSGITILCRIPKAGQLRPTQALLRDLLMVLVPQKPGCRRNGKYRWTEGGWGPWMRGANRSGPCLAKNL